MPISISTHTAAVLLAREHGLSFYDALIVASAVEADCDTLYSEDMQHGRVFGALVIVDPSSREISAQQLYGERD